jgi:ABC-type uncharacterized transport system permease subunit
MLHWTGKHPPLLEAYSIMLRNSLVREMSFKANFVLWMLAEVLWFCGRFFSSASSLGQTTSFLKTLRLLHSYS